MNIIITGKDKMISYYERCIRNNRLWWCLEQSQAIHAGYWDETTHTLQQALNRENEILAGVAKIQACDCILDVGCGVGGSAIFLANAFGCKVKGIDVGEKLIRAARKYAEEAKVSTLVEFEVMDYNSTIFPGGSFDVIWALESVCHAEDKEKFIREAWRLLKSKGRLVIADGFCVREENNVLDKKLLYRSQQYFGISSYASLDKFKEVLESCGFYNILMKDVSQHIMPSAKRLFYYSFPLILWSTLGEYLGWSTIERTQDFKGYYYQYQPLKEGITAYVLIFAEKP
jgi:tocopherol O-methyltransferase